jgi:predicted nucleotidyltransferase component of viral defense system
VKIKCQSVHRNPKHHGTHPTYTIKAGYQLPGDPYFADFETSTRTVSSVAELEISLNDVVCEDRKSSGAAGDVRVTVCVLEDIIAEKLRALLQQPIRNRNRKQDVYDIARMIQLHGSSLDREKIGKYLLQKGGARHVEVSRSAFNADVRRRAEYEYETLFSRNDPDFIPFDQAWSAVMHLVAEIPIPS